MHDYLISKHTLVSWLVFCLIILGACHSNEEVRTSPLPNIVLVMADDQGWGDMGYTGHPEIYTPHFDQAAKESLRFDRFYAAAPVCSPTRASVLTGRHPNRMGAFSWGFTLRPQEYTLAERLQTLGYSTGHFGKWHLGAVQQGSPVSPGNSGFDQWLSAPNFFENDPILSREGIAEQMAGESSQVTVDAAWDFITRNHKASKPYLAVVWFGSPHRPHEAVQQDQDTYSHLADTTLRHFYGEITGMDRAFGSLRERIRNLPHSENTIIWYCSDNGGLPHLGRTGGRGNKIDIYEGGLRVPAFIDWPKQIKQHEVVSFPCNTSDILPSIMEIVGHPIQADDLPLDGISLLPVITKRMDFSHRGMGFWQYSRKGIRTPSALWMRELLEAQQQGEMITDSARLRLDAHQVCDFPTDSFPGHAAWLSWPWKLHRIQTAEYSTPIWELYDLQVDSLEASNIVDAFPDQVQQMKVSLKEWMESVVASMNGEDY